MTLTVVPRDPKVDEALRVIYALPNRTVVHTDSLRTFEAMAGFGARMAVALLAGNGGLAVELATKLLQAHGDSRVTLAGKQYDIRDGKVTAVQP